MNALQLVTNTSQSILTNGIIPLETITRRKGCNIALQGNNIILKKVGYYKITLIVNFVGTTTGDASIKILRNGVDIIGSSSTKTIATASTEYNQLISEIITRVYCNEGEVSISFINSGIGITSNNIIAIVEDMN